MRPWILIASATTEEMVDSGAVMSRANGVAPREASSVISGLLGLRAVAITLSPRARAAFVMAVPKPEVEPVISQTRGVVMVAYWCVGWTMFEGGV